MKQVVYYVSKGFINSRGDYISYESEKRFDDYSDAFKYFEFIAACCLSDNEYVDLGKQIVEEHPDGDILEVLDDDIILTSERRINK